MEIVEGPCLAAYFIKGTSLWAKMAEGKASEREVSCKENSKGRWR